VIPQLSDAVEVLNTIDITDGVDLAGLVPNKARARGRARTSGPLDEVIVFLTRPRPASAGTSPAGR
jgi:hypothetical protein